MTEQNFPYFSILNERSMKLMKALKLKLIVCFGVSPVPFFPRVIFLCPRAPTPKKTRRPHTTGTKPHQLKTPTPKTQSQTPTPKPQTPIKEQNNKKNYKESPWEKNIAFLLGTIIASVIFRKFVAK